MKGQAIVVVEINTLPKQDTNRYSLLNTVPIETPEDPTWQFDGIIYPTPSCEKPQLLPLGCGREENYPNQEKPSFSHYGTEEACLVQTVHGDICTTQQLGQRNFKENAQKNLELGESFALEQGLWTGAGIKDSTVRSCFDDGNLDWCWFGNSPEQVCPEFEGPLCPRDALSALEDELWKCCVVGYIHVPRVLINYLCDWLETDDQGRLRTKLGSIVVAGTGYDNTAPFLTPEGGDPVQAETAVGETWIYGTGGLRLFKGSLEFTPEDQKDAIEFKKNLVEYRAERIWGIGLDPCCPVLTAKTKFC